MNRDWRISPTYNRGIAMYKIYPQGYNRRIIQSYNHDIIDTYNNDQE